MSDIDIRVRTLIAEELGRPLSSVVPATLLREDLGVATEDLSYLLAEIESELGIAIEPPAPARIRSVSDIIRLVEGERAGFARR